jgi:hypothetical protein
MDPDEIEVTAADEDVAWALDGAVHRGGAMARRARPDIATGRLDATALLVAPTTLAGERTLPVADGLVDLVPGGALQRGWVVGVEGVGATSLAFALGAGATATGSWLALVGLTSAGLPAAAGLGVELGRVAVVDAPPAEQRAMVVAALLDAVELVLVGPEARLRAADARRLAARAREHGGVLISLAPGATGSTRAGATGRHGVSVEPDLVLRGTREVWQGLERGHGHLRSRRLSVETAGRRAAARPTTVDLWLPGPDGQVCVIDPPARRRDQVPWPSERTPESKKAGVVA